MATTTLHSGGYKHNNSTILGAGNVSSTSQANSLSLADAHRTVSKKNAIAQSGVNLGTIRSNNSYRFNSQEEGEYVGMIVCDSVASAANTTLKGGAADFGQEHRPGWYGYNRIDVTINAETGAVTKNAANGGVVRASGIDNVVGRSADHAISTTGEFTYMVKGPTATNGDYS